MQVVRLSTSSILHSIVEINVSCMSEFILFEIYTLGGFKNPPESFRDEFLVK